MLKVSPLFSDGAVLCREKELRIFGEADSGALIRCELRDRDHRLLAEGTGVAQDEKFLILLPPQKAQINCTLLLTSETESCTARDIAIGEVFLAGGQSNMELELQNADEGLALIAAHQHPLIRYINIPKFGTFNEAREEAWNRLRWQSVSPGEARDISAVAYFFAVKLQEYLNIPIGIIDSYLGGTSVTCWMDPAWLERTSEGKRYLSEYHVRTAGVTLEAYSIKERAFLRELEDWNRRVAEFKADHPACTSEELTDAVGACPWNPPEGPASPYRPAGLYDTMIAPLAPFALSGMLYYQGEADAGLTDQYDVLMMSLIDRWRTAFRDESLPFLFVQLPMWIDRNTEDSKTWPALRLRQAEVRDRMRNTGMVCLIDQGEYNNIHPTNKRVVGERLFELAKSLLYHQEGASAPRVIGKRIENNTLILLTDQPLSTPDQETPMLLELAEADRNFVPARAQIEENRLILSAPELAHPFYSRYAWTDFGSVNLFAANGLPLEPFDC